MFISMIKAEEKVLGWRYLLHISAAASCAGAIPCGAKERDSLLCWYPGPFWFMPLSRTLSLRHFYWFSSSKVPHPRAFSVPAHSSLASTAGEEERRLMLGLILRDQMIENHPIVCDHATQNRAIVHDRRTRHRVILGVTLRVILSNYVTQYHIIVHDRGTRHHVRLGLTLGLTCRWAKICKIT